MPPKKEVKSKAKVSKAKVPTIEEIKEVIEKPKQEPKPKAENPKAEKPKKETRRKKSPKPEPTKEEKIKLAQAESDGIAGDISKLRCELELIANLNVPEIKEMVNEELEELEDELHELQAVIESLNQL